jgi:hypothetical protein
MPDLDPSTLAALAALNGGAAGNLSSGTTGADLANFQRTITANDPWNMALQPVLATKLNTATWTPNQALAGNLGQAALAAVLRTLGNRSEADQMFSAAQVLPQLYKDPLSVATPDGVDPEAFNALRFSAIGHQATTNDVIRRTLGEHGVSYNADGSLNTDALEAITTGRRPSVDFSTASPDFKKALEDAGGDVPTARQLLKSRLGSEATLGSLSKSISVINQLEALKHKPQTLSSSWVPDSVEGVVNDLASKFYPGSNAATYNSAVIPIADSLLRALTEVGRGSQYNLEKIINDLSEGFAKGPDALSARIKNYQEDLLIGAQQKASDLVANGHIGFSPVLDQVQNMDLNKLGQSAQAPEPPPGYELTGRMDANGNYGIRKIK